MCYAVVSLKYLCKECLHMLEFLRNNSEEETVFCVCVCVCNMCTFWFYKREKCKLSLLYKVVQIWPGLFVCKQVTVCPGHIWTTLYFSGNCLSRLSGWWCACACMTSQEHLFADHCESYAEGMANMLCVFATHEISLFSFYRSRLSPLLLSLRALM